MNVGGAAVWGLIGGSCVEALWLYARIRQEPLWSWRKPIPQGLTAYLISVILRVGAGAGLAAAAAGSGQISGIFAAFVLGVSAPLVIEKLAQVIPLTGPLIVESPERGQPDPWIAAGALNPEVSGGQPARAQVKGAQESEAGGI